MNFFKGRNKNKVYKFDDIDTKSDVYEDTDFAPNDVSKKRKRKRCVSPKTSKILLTIYPIKTVYSMYVF